MYADYSRDQVNAFLSDLTSQPKAGAVEHVAEAFSDEMFIAVMELSRFKKCHAENKPFVARNKLFGNAVRVHPADFQ